MRKSVFKMLSVITALCLLLYALPVFASAGSNEYLSYEGEDVVYFSPETALPLQYGSAVNQFYSSGAPVDVSRYFYDQLTENQKVLYDQIKAAGPVQNIKMNMSGLSIIGSGNSQNAAANNMSSQITADVKMALSALCEDYPLFFWMSGFSWNNASYSPYTENGVYKARLSSLTVVVNIDTTHFTDYNDVKNKYNAVIEKLDTIKINGINRHEKLKSIHDYLSDNIVYDDTISEPNIFDIYGALVNGVCVCEGYAEATKLLCDREGIPCLNVVGTGAGGAHKWNYIQMDDNEWYLYDVTWDDQASTTYYSYFLIGSSTKAPFFSNSTVADSTVHIPTGTMFSGATPLSYPTLSDDTYSVGILRYGAPDISVLKTKNVIIVGKGQTSFLTYFVSNSSLGYTRKKTGSGTTGSKLTLGDGASTAEYLIAMRGDVKKSNTVNTDDYLLITEICNTSDALVAGSAEFYAADMTQDGAVDGFDAIALELYINDQLTFD